MARISEIFLSCQGEGVHAGIPMVFVRMQGCNLQLPRCNYCDTAYAQKDVGGLGEMSTEEVMKTVVRLYPYVHGWTEVTGGEPLFQPDDLRELILELRREGFHTTVETNGSYKPPSWYTLVDSWCADIKCPSSGVCGVSSEVWFQTRQQDQIKFVVGDETDLNFVTSTLQKHPIYSPTVLLSPTTPCSVDWMRRVWAYCCVNRLRFSLQIHKILYGNQRGV